MGAHYTWTNTVLSKETPVLEAILIRRKIAGSKYFLVRDQNARKALAYGRQFEWGASSAKRLG